jgi:vitamin B12 transporter
MSLTIIFTKIEGHYSRYFAILIAILFSSATAYSNPTVYPDTIKVSTITVTAANYNREMPFSSILIDSSLIESNRHTDVGRLLQYSAPVFLKRYGTDGIASLSVRGLSGSHTGVIWNGIEINAPMTGQTDFSLLPAFAIEQIKLSPGGADLSNISGSIGGKLEISGDDKISAGFHSRAYLGRGSYGKYSGGLALSAGSAKFESSTKVWFRNAQNNFLFYKDSIGGSVKQYRKNSAVHSRGVLEDITFSGKRQLISAHAWYNDTYRELPSPVNSAELYGNQKDKSLRVTLNYKYVGNRIKMDLVSGYINETNIFNDSLPQHHGNNKSQTFSIRSAIRVRGSGSMGFSFNIGDEFQKASSLSYDKTRFRNMMSVSVLSDYQLGEKLRFLAQMREVIIDAAGSVPELTIGASFKTDNTGKNVIKANISHNTRYPCLNDLFWSPGGNEKLKTETSTGGELEFTHFGNRENVIFADLSVTLFDSKVTDLIQWAQGQYSYWEAMNLKNVNANGAELAATTYFQPGMTKLKVLSSYAFTRSIITSSETANDASVGSQIIYMPRHTVNLLLTAEYKIFKLESSMLYSSRRFTASDNSEWLKGYFLTDLSAGLSLSGQRAKIDVDLSVDNLLNAEYESVKGYPMPLRTFMLNLILTPNLQLKK